MMKRSINLFVAALLLSNIASVAPPFEGLIEALLTSQTELIEIPVEEEDTQTRLLLLPLLIREEKYPHPDDDADRD